MSDGEEGSLRRAKTNRFGLLAWAAHIIISPRLSKFKKFYSASDQGRAQLPQANSTVSPRFCFFTFSFSLFMKLSQSHPWLNKTTAEK